MVTPLVVNLLVLSWYAIAVPSSLTTALPRTCRRAATPTTPPCPHHRPQQTSPGCVPGITSVSQGEWALPILHSTRPQPRIGEPEARRQEPCAAPRTPGKICAIRSYLALRSGRDLGSGEGVSSSTCSSQLPLCSADNPSPMESQPSYCGCRPRADRVS